MNKYNSKKKKKNTPANQPYFYRNGEKKKHRQTSVANVYHLLSFSSSKSRIKNIVKF